MPSHPVSVCHPDVLLDQACPASSRRALRAGKQYATALCSQTFAVQCVQRKVSGASEAALGEEVVHDRAKVVKGRLADSLGVIRCQAADVILIVIQREVLKAAVASFVFKML